MSGMRITHCRDPSIATSRAGGQGATRRTASQPHPRTNEVWRVHVIIDTRERGKVVRLLTSDPNISCRLQPLRVGDYLIDHRILIERKTLTDFSKSILDGRLFRQASRLSSAPEVPVIILEGTRAFRAVPRKQLQGALLSLTMVFQIPLLRSRDETETVWLMHALARQSRVRRGRGFRTRTANPTAADGRRVHAACALPGVGHELAVRLLQHFGTLRAIYGASHEELVRVPGIGTRRAKAIVAFVTAQGREPSNESVT